MLNWKHVSAALSAVVLVGGAYTAYDKLRPWPTRDEHNLVANRTCKVELDLYRGEKRDIERDLGLADQAGNMEWKLTLNAQLADVTSDIEDTRKECNW